MSYDTGGVIADGAVTTAKLADGAVTNVKVSATAAIALTKLAVTPLQTVQRGVGFTGSLGNALVTLVSITPTQYPCNITCIGMISIVAGQIPTLSFRANDGTGLSGTYFRWDSDGGISGLAEADVTLILSGRSGFGSHWIFKLRLTAAPAGGEPLLLRAVYDLNTLGNARGSVDITS